MAQKMKPEEQADKEEAKQQTAEELAKIQKAIAKNVEKANPNKTLIQKLAKAVTQQPIPKATHSQKTSSNLTLNTQAEAMQAILETFKKNFPIAGLSRKEIAEMVHAEYPENGSMTRGRTKSGNVKPKPRWKSNVAWAIQILYKNGTLTKIGRDQYVLNTNSNITLMPSKPAKTRMPRNPKLAVQVKQPSQVAVQSMQPVIPTTSSNTPAGQIQAPHTKEKPYYPDPDLQIVMNSKLKNKNAPMEIIEGKAGLAKTKGVEYFAKINGLKCIRLQCGAGTTETDLIGQYMPRVSASGSQETYFEEGRIPVAIDEANKYGTAVLLIDEINALKPEYQKYLNSLTGYEKSITGPGNRKWEVNPESNLIIVATMNPGAYRATYPLNEELKGRSATFYLDYPPLEIERQVLKDSYNDIKLIDKLILLAKHTRTQNEENEDFYPISPRDESYVMDDYKTLIEGGVKPEKALELSLNRFILTKYREHPEQKDDLEAVREKIREIFNIDIKLKREE